MASDDPNLFVRAVWFLLIGWWASGIWLAVAWLCNVTIVGIPLGIKLINYTPMVVSLKTSAGVDDTLRESRSEQRGLVIRGLWFLLVGWWLSGIWISVAYLLTLSIIGMPIAVVMYNQLPFIVSLYEY